MLRRVTLVPLARTYTVFTVCEATGVVVTRLKGISESLLFDFLLIPLRRGYYRLYEKD